MQENIIEFVISIYRSKGDCNDVDKSLLDPGFSWDDKLAGSYLWCDKYCPLKQHDKDLGCLSPNSYKAAIKIMKENPMDFIDELI